jgi:hypothetical protein
VLVPDKEEYAIVAVALREVRAKNNCDYSVDDDDLQSRTSEETYRAQRTRTIDRDDTKLFLYHASVDDKISDQELEAALKRSTWKSWLTG